MALTFNLIGIEELPWEVAQEVGESMSMVLTGEKHNYSFNFLPQYGISIINESWDPNFDDMLTLKNQLWDLLSSNYVQVDRITVSVPEL